MPGNLKNTVPNRFIRSELKSHKIVWEEEHPIRWSYMKILREYSTLRQFYPQIDPYVEVYPVRDNMYAIFQESMDGAGDVWMYLIDGPEKALLIDTGFGVGDLKSLVKKLVHDKELIVFNTHCHFDHCYGDAQFGKVYCYADEVFGLKTKNNPGIWDYLYDPQTRKGIYTEFDPDDIIEFRSFEIEGVKENHTFDLGGGYLCEVIPLVGHTSGQAGILDHVSRTLICGDVTSIGRPLPDDPHKDNCTVEAMTECFAKIWARNDEYDGVFFGHAMLDQTKTIIRYHLDACERVLKNPEDVDEIHEINQNGQKRILCKKYIQQSTALKFSPDQVYRRQIR